MIPSVTLAFGSTFPAASVTVPESVDGALCAWRGWREAAIKQINAIPRNSVAVFGFIESFPLG
jgi:hypothetical protein